MSATGERRAAGPAEAGATLLEMLVVVGLLALATGLVFPALRRPYERVAAEATYAAVAAELRMARAEAARTEQETRFIVAGDGRAYTSRGRSVLLPAAVRLAASAPVVFEKDGSSAGGRLTLITRNARATMLVEPPSGLVKAGERTP